MTALVVPTTVYLATPPGTTKDRSIWLIRVGLRGVENRIDGLIATVWLAPSCGLETISVDRTRVPCAVLVKTRGIWLVVPHDTSISVAPQRCTPWRRVVINWSRRCVIVPATHSSPKLRSVRDQPSCRFASRRRARKLQLKITMTTHTASTGSSLSKAKH